VIEASGHPGSGFVHAPIFKFRGARSYVHSTDLYQELVLGVAAAGLPPVDGAVELKLRLPITTQPELHFLTGDSAGAASAGSFVLVISGRPIFGQIVATDRPVSERKTYDEDAIWSRSRIEGRCIALETGSGMLPIEVITALGVRLHKTLFPPSAGERWLLSKLNLVRPLEAGDAPTASVRIERTIGKSMTRCALAASDFHLGTMDFIVGQDRSRPA